MPKGTAAQNLKLPGSLAFTVPAGELLPQCLPSPGGVEMKGSPRVGRPRCGRHREQLPSSGAFARPAPAF